MTHKTVVWFKSVTGKPWMMYFLAVTAFLESIIFPIPIDIFTFTLSAAHPKKWWRYGTVATIFSVLGAVGGYILGAYLFASFGQEMISFYGYEDEFITVTELFNSSVFWVMFASAFTPIPFKVFTVAGGALNVAFLPFLIASILGRGFRFFLECYLPYRFGEKVGAHLMKNINKYMLLAVFAVVIYFLGRYLFQLYG